MINDSDKAKALADLDIAYQGQSGLKSYYWRESVERMLNEWVDKYMDTIRAALTAEVTQTSEPVLWQLYDPEYPEEMASMTFATRGDAIEERGSGDGEIRALYAHPDRTSEALLAALKYLHSWCKNWCFYDQIELDDGEQCPGDMAESAIQQHEAGR